MALGALIAAYQEGSGNAPELRATLPLAGRTLVEYQARLVHAVGARPIVLLVERMPPALIAAVDRLAADGIAVQLARDVDQAAGFFASEDAVIIVAGGLFADAASIEGITAAKGSTILTLADDAGLESFERIDANSRWAGLALANGAQLAATVAMLGDWDLQSTLLRRLVQDGARRLSATAVSPTPMLLMASGARDLDDAERRILAAARGTRGDWVERFVTPIVEEFAVERLMTTRARPRWLVAGALGLTLLAAFFFLRGWLGAAMIALLLSVPLDGIGERLAALRMQPLARGDPLKRALPFASAAALAALAAHLARHGSGWGCMATVAAALAFFHAGEVERAGKPRSSWLASRKGSILLGLPFAATGHWTSGLIAVAIHAAGSFLWLQHLTHHRTVVTD